ncbi:MAG: hypothetical protein M5U32_12850 [Myxococcota bacterium]|nr:hypothetical protein [Myxococcota bacterium]
MKNSPTAATSSTGARNCGDRATNARPSRTSRHAVGRGSLGTAGATAGTPRTANDPARNTAASTPSIGTVPSQRAAAAAAVPSACAPNCTAVIVVTACIRSGPATRESSASRAGITKADTVPRHRP